MYKSSVPTTEGSAPHSGKWWLTGRTDAKNGSLRYSSVQWSNEFWSQKKGYIGIQLHISVQHMGCSFPDNATEKQIKGILKSINFKVLNYILCKTTKLIFWGVRYQKANSRVHTCASCFYQIASNRTLKISLLVQILEPHHPKQKNPWQM